MRRIDFVQDPRNEELPLAHLRLGPQRQLVISWSPQPQRNTLVRAVHVTPCDGLFVQIALSTPGAQLEDITMDWLIPEVLNMSELTQPLVIGQQLLFTLQNRGNAPLSFCIGVGHELVVPS